MAKKARVNQFFLFYFVILGNIYGRKSFREKKFKKSLFTFLLLFNDLKYGKNSLFCCNGYCHAIFTILFYESQVKHQVRKAFTKEKKNLKVLMTILLLFYYFFMT